jgi:predicted lactoylglutathione lyase
MSKSIFVNLPVKDLNRTKEFFSKIGYTFNPQFTDDNAACMVIEENIFAMLLREEFFSTFTERKIADTSNTVEVLIALSEDSREAVDSHVDKAIAAGGKQVTMKDYGFMYYRSYADLDGHVWEVTHMDMSQVPANPGDAQVVAEA